MCLSRGTPVVEDRVRSGRVRNRGLDFNRQSLSRVSRRVRMNSNSVNNEDSRSRELELDDLRETVNRLRGTVASLERELLVSQRTLETNRLINVSENIF